MDEDWAIGPGLPSVCSALTDTLADRSRPIPDPTVGFALAVCSAYAYGNARTLATIMDRLGLTRNRCRMVSEYVDALYLTSTAFLIQSEDGRVLILCYRGTPPTSLITWMTDFQVAPVTIPKLGGCVHGGFYRNMRCTRFAIRKLIERAMSGRSILEGGQRLPKPLEAIYLTGHSLGGATANMLAASLEFEATSHDAMIGPLRAVYTYGAPMIGDPAFAAACEGAAFLHDNVIRYVYAQDIVPQTPPTASGHFQHFGRELRWSDTWQPSASSQQLHNLLQVATTPLSLLATTFTRARRIHYHASLGDHFPQNYIDALTPPPLRSEFGD